MKWPLVSRARFDARMRALDTISRNIEKRISSHNSLYTTERAGLVSRMLELESRVAVAELKIQTTALAMSPPSPPSEPRLHRRVLNALRVRTKRGVKIFRESGKPVTVNITADGFHFASIDKGRPGRRG